MSAVNVDTIKAALRAWVIRGSALPAGQVIWTLGKRTPPSPYISMRLSIRTVGQDWVDTVANPTPTTPGTEALYKVRGNRVLKLSMQCFADEASSGQRAPEEILDDVITALALPSVSTALAVAKVGIADVSDITPIDGVINSTRFEPRALVTVTMHAIAAMSEAGPVIEEVEITSSVEGFPDEVFEVDVTP